MATYKLIVLSNPKSGQEIDYNDWYSNQHLQDVTAIPGYRSAQRFELADGMGLDHQWRYLAIYEVETDDIAATVLALTSRQGTESMTISPALDLDGAIAGVFRPMTGVVDAASD